MGRNKTTKACAKANQDKMCPDQDKTCFLCGRKTELYQILPDYWLVTCDHCRVIVAGCHRRGQREVREQ